MKKFLLLLAAVVMFAAPAVSLAQTLTDYEYSRLTFGNNFANQKVKPIILNADRGLHAPVSTLALLAAIEYGARYQGMMVNVDTGLYFYDATDCPGGSTSPTAVAPDDANGCWYLTSASADIWATLADTTPVSGASLIGIKDTATYYTGTDVETALAEIGAEFLTKQDLAVPAAVGNIATLDATGQVIDSTDSLAELMYLIGTPTNGNFACTDALGQAYDCGSAPADFTLRSDVQAFMAATGNENEIVTAALTGTLMPVAPAEGYRAFCTEDGGSFSEGKIYAYKDGAWDSGENVTAGQMVGVVSGDIVVGGTSLTDWQALSEKLDRNSLACKDITVALNADTGTTAADPDWVSAYYLSASPVSGADQVVASVTIAGDGAITLVTAAVSTAQAVYRVCAILD